MDFSEKLLGSPAPFPKVSHVQQKNINHIVWSSPAPLITLNPSPITDFSSDYPGWSSLNEKTELFIHSANKFDDPPLTPTADQKYFIKQLKKTVSFN